MTIQTACYQMNETYWSITLMMQRMHCSGRWEMKQTRRYHPNHVTSCHFMTHLLSLFVLQTDTMTLILCQTESIEAEVPHGACKAVKWEPEYFTEARVWDTIKSPVCVTLSFKPLMKMSHQHNEKESCTLINIILHWNKRFAAAVCCSPSSGMLFSLWV